MQFSVVRSSGLVCVVCEFVVCECVCVCECECEFECECECECVCVCVSVSVCERLCSLA